MRLGALAGEINGTGRRIGTGRPAAQVLRAGGPAVLPGGAVVLRDGPVVLPGGAVAVLPGGGHVVRLIPGGVVVPAIIRGVDMTWPRALVVRHAPARAAP